MQSVSNLWIPIFLGALSRLKDGGSFAFIVPAECLTGTSGRVARTWLIRHTQELLIDLFPAGSFPGVLQEVVVLSGLVRRDGSDESKVEVYDHATDQSWRHAADTSLSTWTGLLLTPEHLSAISYAQSMPQVLPLGMVAKISVATVTGANQFFTLDESRRDRYHLHKWTRPLLARTRQAPGLDFAQPDFERNRADGLSCWLLDANFPGQDVASTKLGWEYIKLGEGDKLQDRYKCSIRTPWYQVPIVKPGSLLLSKRSHRYPRLIRNSAGALSTDTIYQGQPLGPFAGREADIVSSFHNSLTLLSAELFGRSFGGGVLELVPSEVSSLLLPLAELGEPALRRLDAVVRQTGHDSEAIVEATDDLLMKCLPELEPNVMATVRDARALLLARRVARN